MVYIFEDRKDRMTAHYNGSLDKDVIREGIITCSGLELEKYLGKNYADAKAILFHKSYVFPNSSVKIEMVYRQFANRKIPFVYFSGGLQNNLTSTEGTYTATVNSGDMYNNLPEFLKMIKEQGTVNIPVIIYGTRYLLNSVLEISNLVSYLLFDLSDDHSLTNETVENVLDIIRNGMNEKELIGPKSKLESWLESRNSNNTNVLKKELTTQIQKLLDKLDTL